MVASVVKREAVTYLRDGFKVSERRACHILDIHRSLIRYKSKRPEDIDLRKRLRKLSVKRRRFGYRRLHVLLAREGIQINHKKLWRIYKEEGLSVRKRGGRKRAIGTRRPIVLPSKVNERWSLDFVSDSFMDTQRQGQAPVDVLECYALLMITAVSVWL